MPQQRARKEKLEDSTSGNVSKLLPKNIIKSWFSRRGVAVYAEDLQKVESLWPLTTITLPGLFEDYSVSFVTNGSLGRVPLTSLSKQQLILLSLQLNRLLEETLSLLVDRSGSVDQGSGSDEL